MINKTERSKLEKDNAFILHHKSKKIRIKMVDMRVEYIPGKILIDYGQMMVFFFDF